MFRFFISLTILLLSVDISASDLAKEKRWADQIIDSLLDGEAIYLNDGRHEFLALDTLPESSGEQAVILLHGIGVHPDWPQVIHPLRVQLPESGWRTLSLQLPVLANEATGEDYQPLMRDVPARINAGIDYLQKDGVKRIVIVAHSLGAEMASYYLAKQKTPVAAYVGIGMGSRNTEYLKSINIPVLDIYGSKDLQSVLESVANRQQASKNNGGYKQLRIEQADHFFENRESELLEAVMRWLKRD